MTNPAPRITFAIPFSRRVLLFGCVALFCFIISALLSGLLGSEPTPPRIRLAAIAQDILLFITPAIVTALLITRRPADFLLISHTPPVRTYLVTLLAFLCALPLIDASIALNARIPLPDTLIQFEQANDATIALIFGRGDIPSFIVVLLIVAILAPLAEELFFRGTIQRLLSTAGINIHLAIWLTAIIFSAVHLEFQGFIPRMLLGAFFGYCLYWTKSLWIAIWAHITNNILSAIQMWLRFRNNLPLEDPDPTYPAPWLLLTSILLTIAALFILSRLHTPSTQP